MWRPPSGGPWPAHAGRHVQLFVGRKCQKLLELVGSRDLLEQPPRLGKMSAIESRRADFVADARVFFADALLDERLRHDAAVVQLRMMPDPLPDLRARDLGG